MQEIIVPTPFGGHESVLLVFTNEPVPQGPATVVCFILVETQQRSKHRRNSRRQPRGSALSPPGMTVQVKCILGCGVCIEGGLCHSCLLTPQRLFSKPSRAELLRLVNPP